MDWTVDDQRVPRIAAAILLTLGVLALLFSGLIFVISLPAYLGVSIPPNYRIFLAVLAIAGGIAHIMAGVWSRNQGSLFRIVVLVLVGMVLLQVTAPFDILVLLLIFLGRAQFEESSW